MKIVIDNQEYNIIVNRKISNKNMYLKVKEDMNIYITCNTFISDKKIMAFVEDNKRFILKNIERLKKKKEKEAFFYYLGKKYDIIYLNQKGIMVGDEKIFVDSDFNLDKWLKKEAERIFQEELNRMYQNFIYEIPFPSLTIRKMKTRWGVCNVKTRRVTLNLELIKKDKKYLDYVIIHELSHLLYPNHSKAFWQCVENNFHEYKEIRKELKYE